MPKLVVESGKHKGQNLRLPAGKEVVVGREKSCAIHLSSPAVSPRHCVLRSVSGQLYVRDLGSEQGTYLNDEPIQQEVALQEGDLLKIGPVLFRVPTSADKAPAETSGQSSNEQTSDEEILNWLAEGGSSGEFASSTEAPVSSGAAPAPSPAAETPSKPRFHSIAEEAADIIRRHQEHMGEAPSAEEG